jgi:hypothetical protein
VTALLDEIEQRHEAERKAATRKLIERSVRLFVVFAVSMLGLLGFFACAVYNVPIYYSFPLMLIPIAGQTYCFLVVLGMIER